MQSAFKLLNFLNFFKLYQFKTNLKKTARRVPRESEGMRRSKGRPLCSPPPPRSLFHRRIAGEAGVLRLFLLAGFTISICADVRANAERQRQYIRRRFYGEQWPPGALTGRVGRTYRRGLSHQPEARVYQLESGLSVAKFPPEVPEQYHLFTAGFDEEFVNNTIVVQQLMNRLLGGYDRYVYAAYSLLPNTSAPDATKDNSRLLGTLNDLGYRVDVSGDNSGGWANPSHVLWALHHGHHCTEPARPAHVAL